jgi:general secretion pathway protein L
MRAAEFLDGIVRAQIDRLTPWTAGDAVYCWTLPRAAGGDRIALTLAATARAMVLPLVQAVLVLGPAAVKVSTAAPETDFARVGVYSEAAAGEAGVWRVRAAVVAILVASGVAAAASIGAAEWLTDRYDAQHDLIQRQIGERSAAIRASRSGAGDPRLEALWRRKHEAPSSVLAIDALSALLPDHTYATEIRIEGDRLQIIGMTRDAPSLIGLLETSPHFADAAFFAPTTRGPNDPSERFHIEARLKPYFRGGT